MKEIETIAIIGTGRMGSLLAHKLCKEYDLILIDKDIRRCGMLAKELNGLGTSEYSILSFSDYIIVSLPDRAIPETIEMIKPYVGSKQILINISTNTDITIFEPLKDLCKLVSAKMIGHAHFTATTGELPLFIIDGNDMETRNKTAKIFAKIGPISFGDEKTVRNINKIASEEGIKAAINITEKLGKMSIPIEHISFAIRNVACGTMGAYALGDVGPFAKKLIDGMETNQN